ncbi:MAG: hypothetical protein ACK40V_10755, partial [Anaerolineales bacterium]
MKNIIFLLIALILCACTPQVTVTSEVTATLAPPTQTPIPTPTLHPQFSAWQELISSSGRYTLTPDGLIQENGVAIAGLQVDSNGVMTLTVNNEKIILTLNDVSFDDEKGLIIDGYELDENGEWVEAEEPVKEFPVCSSVEYRDCKLESVDDLAEYYRWFETLAQPFEAGQLDQRPWYLDGLGTIVPDLWVPREPGTVTAHLNITFAVLEVDGIQYKIIP